MVIPDSVVQSLEKFTKELVEVDKKCDEETHKIRLAYREKMEPLFADRHALIKTIDGFWTDVLSCPETPLFDLLNGTIDPKILRAVTDFKVVSQVKGDTLLRKFVITFRSNMFVEEGEIYREVDTDMKTTSMSPIKWKSGTERTRTDSFFSFFSDSFPNDQDAISEVTEALDVIYQNPFLAMEED